MRLPPLLMMDAGKSNQRHCSVKRLPTPHADAFAFDGLSVAPDGPSEPILSWPATEAAAVYGLAQTAADGGAGDDSVFVDAGGDSSHAAANLAIDGWFPNATDPGADSFGTFVDDGGPTGLPDSPGAFGFFDDATLHSEFDAVPLVHTGGFVEANPLPQPASLSAQPLDFSDSANSPSLAALSQAPEKIAGDLAELAPLPNSFSIGDSSNAVNAAAGHGQGIGSIPNLEFVGPDGPEPVSANVGPVGAAHPGTIEGSVTTANTGSGIDISQVTTNANGSTTETVSFAGSGIVFNDTFDTSVTQAYKSCILSAEQAIASEWTNSVTINEEFSAQAEGQNGDLASNNFYVDGVSYATLKSALTTLASQEPNDSDLQQAVAHLPTTDPTGGEGFELALPYARMLGLTSASESPDDTVTLNTSYNWSYGQDVINTVEHEISEGGMGRIGGLGDQNSFWSVMDLFRYNASGVADYSDGRDGQTTYFSLNGGATLSSLSFNNEFNSADQKVNGGDTADFVQQDVFGTGDPGETNTYSQTDLAVMAALGWDPQVPAPVVTVPNATVQATSTQAIAVSTLFSSTDPGGVPLFYLFYESPSDGGHFVLNGTTTEPIGQNFNVPASELSDLTYVPAANSSDSIMIGATTADTWSGWSTLQIDGPVVPSPVVTVPNPTVQATSTQPIAVSTLFSSTDPGGVPLFYLFYESPSDGGHFVLNGTTTEPTGQNFSVPASELSDLTYVPAANSSDSIMVGATTADTWSGWSTLQIDGPAEAAATSQSGTSVTTSGSANDTFVFTPGGGADVAADTSNSDWREHHGSSPLGSAAELRMLLHAAQADHAMSPFEIATTTGDHDSAAFANTRLADVHAHHFIIH
jgi:hypothetical protein